MRAPVLLAAAFALAACTEIPQDAVKPYAGKDDTKAYAGDMFKGDKGKYEKALATRAQAQNEYVRNEMRQATLGEATKTK